MRYQGLAVKTVCSGAAACIVALAMAFLLLAAPSGAQAPPASSAPPPAPAVTAAPAPPVPRGDLEITVVAADGKKFKNCTVFVREQAVAFGEDGGPKLVKGVPAPPDGSVAVTADARVAQGAGKPDRRYVGVAEVSPEANKSLKVKVSMEPVDDIDAYCAGCHPGKGQRAGRGQIRRDVHPSGKPLIGRYREQVRIYNATVERLTKEGKPHNQPILVDERIVKEGGKEVKRDFYTCESCHTPHWETPLGKYARANFRQESDLCTGCHF